MSFDIRPLGTRLIVSPKSVPETVGMIYIPETTRELVPTEGTVVAIGEGVTNISVGDTVYYGRYAGFHFDRNNKKYVFLSQDDVLGIIKTEE